VASASEAERIGIYRDAALDFIRQHPAQAAGLYVAKLKAFWWGSESTGILYPSGWVLAYDAWYVAVLALAASGCWRGLRDPTSRPGVVLVLATLALISLSQAIFYVEGRHRLAIEPLLLVLSAGGLAAAWMLLAQTVPLVRVKSFVR
jgi:hypothetical protein